MYSSSSLSFTQLSYHPSIHKAIYPISHPSMRHRYIHPFNYPVSHTSIDSKSHYFINWSIETSIQQKSMYSSPMFSATQTSYHPFIHKAIHQSIIQLASIFLSIWITSQPASHPSNQSSKIFCLINCPTIQSAIQPSNLLLPAIRSTKRPSI